VLVGGHASVPLASVRCDVPSSGHELGDARHVPRNAGESAHRVEWVVHLWRCVDDVDVNRSASGLNRASRGTAKLHEFKAVVARVCCVCVCVLLLLLLGGGGGPVNVCASIEWARRE
jgi:hypothetical protein